MVCIQCSGETRVFNSRLKKRLNKVWRRRECTQCGLVFTSLEEVDYATSLAVRDADGSLKPFSRDKLLLSLYKSLQHRPTALPDASALTDTVIARLHSQTQHSAINDKSIVATAYLVLARFDTVASVHYQAFHKI
jgi:transcriptional regulator NrdR family protein